MGVSWCVVLLQNFVSRASVGPTLDYLYGHSGELGKAVHLFSLRCEEGYRPFRRYYSMRVNVKEIEKPERVLGPT